MLDRLLGPVEEMAADELTSAIGEAGIDLPSAREKLYARVSEMRSKAWEFRVHPTVTSTNFALSGNSISAGATYNAIASRILALASSSVSPADAQPGSSGQTAE